MTSEIVSKQEQQSFARKMQFSSSSRRRIDCAYPSKQLLWGLIVTLVVKSMVCNGFCLIGNPTWKGKPIITILNEDERITNSTNNMKGKIVKNNFIIR